MHATTELVHPVEASHGDAIFAGHMVAVVGKFFTGRDTRGLSDDLVALDDEVAAILVLDDPFAAEEGDGVLGCIANSDKINECVGFVRRQAAAAVVVAQFVEAGGKPG